MVEERKFQVEYSKERGLKVSSLKGKPVEEMVKRYNLSVGESSNTIEEKIPKDVNKEDEEPSIKELLVVVELLEGDDHEMGFSQEELENMMKELQKDKTLLEIMTCNMICTLPITFVAKPNQPSKIKGGVADAQGALTKLVEENVMKDLITFEEKIGEELPKKIIFEKPDEKEIQHLKPLYIFALIDGFPMKKVLIDNGAIVNILPSRMLKTLGKTEEDLFL